MALWYNCLINQERMLLIMSKLALFGCFALMAVGAVHASSCIISGSTERSCSSSDDDTAIVDVRSGGLLADSCVATEVRPFECREYSFGLSTMLSILDCTQPPYRLFFIK